MAVNSFHEHSLKPRRVLIKILRLPVRSLATAPQPVAQPSHLLADFQHRDGNFAQQLLLVALAADFLAQSARRRRA
jgi:hypothetical protein